jgi:hypothetical protein
MDGSPASQVNSSNWTRRCLKGLARASLGALLLLPAFSGLAFATHESFGRYRDWTGGPYYGSSYDTFFADVIGDGTADAIVVNYDTITVRRSMFKDYFQQQDLERICYGN